MTKPTIENIAYGGFTPRPKCGLSTVDVQAKILVNGVEHAGMTTHVCALPKEPYHDHCECACGTRWTRNVK